MTSSLTFDAPVKTGWFRNVASTLWSGMFIRFSYVQSAVVVKRLAGVDAVKFVGILVARSTVS